MDEFDGLEISNIEAKSGAATVATAIGIFAIVLGGISLYIGLLASKELSSFRGETRNGVDKVPLLEKRVDELTVALQKSQQLQKKAEKDLQALLVQSKKAIAQLGDSVNMNRGQINKNRTQLNEVALRFSNEVQRIATASPVSNPAPTQVVERKTGNPQIVKVKAPPAVTVEAEPGGKMVKREGGGFHIVAAGDTFSGVAELYGMSLQDLLKENPTIKPRFLQIGQKIKLPE